MKDEKNFDEKDFVFEYNGNRYYGEFHRLCYERDKLMADKLIAFLKKVNYLENPFEICVPGHLKSYIKEKLKEK